MTCTGANHQIPTIEEMLSDFAKARIFTVLGAKNGFWHLELDDQQVISGLLGVRCIADDIIEAAMQMFRERQIKINRSKAKVALSSVPCFGLVLADKGFHTRPKQDFGSTYIQNPRIRSS